VADEGSMISITHLVATTARVGPAMTA
jgi:hypothetical protein